MKPYEEKTGIGGIFRPSTGDVIIGSQEAQRSTKTFINTERSAIVLSLIQNHAESVVKLVTRLHEKKTGVKLTREEAIEIYPGCKRWTELHRYLVEHYASQEGFSIQATVKLAQSQLLQQRQEPESSIERNGAL